MGDTIGNTIEGMVNLRSAGSVADTLARIEGLLASKGIPIVCRVSHSGAAAEAGLVMPPTELLIFGNPHAGTPLMLQTPTLAIDLPSKALVWQDQEGVVWLSFNTTAYLRARHHLPAEAPGLAALEDLLRRAAAPS